MRLIGIDCQIPSNKVFNEDIIELVKFYSTNKYDTSIEQLETLVRRFLKITGSQTRFWRNDKEKPLDFIKLSVAKSLKMAGISKNEIGLVIYSGIDRGFIEPSNASVLCKSLGLENVRCFDIVDACMGWASAVQTAYSFLNTDPSLNNVLLINAEFPIDYKGTILPENFIIHNSKELDWKAPSFTLGEAASACIFQKDNDTEIKFVFQEESSHAGLCSIPLINYNKYLPEPTSQLQPDMRFYALGAELLENGMKPAVEVLHKLLKLADGNTKAILPHSISKKVIEEAILKAGIATNVVSTFPELGNTATVSIPSAITKGLLNKEIKLGDRLIAWIASAGMKFSAFEIQL